MAIHMARAPKPKEKACPAPTGQASTALLEKLGNQDNIAEAARSQFLSARNIPQQRLGLLAPLIWGALNG
ncbi:hypothetical protein [Rhizorhabdus sp.]|jgi:hypothetical protein|uniref:hypothetical protein n=1 Tax=Rhizorhabdus sp. TaxID=1968843 RepID=UPI0019991C3F|nr:hypothetical protein [Rhizorhabdus sp.]MBD3761467.1 hypothetical protein [Rhizorhabdus sp.]